MKGQRPAAVFGTVVLAGLAMACSSGSTGPAGNQVAFQIATRAGAPSSAFGGPNSEVFALGNDTLVVDTVEVTLRKIELHRTEGSSSCQTQVEEQQDCREMKLDPVVFNLPLGAGASRAFTVPLDPGTYDKLEFVIHKPDGNTAGDAAVLASHPEMDGNSVRVVGTFNGAPFVYHTDAVIEHETELNPPVSVSDSAQADLTLFVDLSHWFTSADSTALVDPASAIGGGPNQALVWQNIVGSFKSFEDHDHNGTDDHHEGSGGL